MDLVKTLTEQYMKSELPEMNVGDTVRVTVRVKEGNRVRNQAFDGTIIAKKHGGINETITVRRISYGVGCEKVFPVHSPTIVSVETLRRGKVRRAKLYYLRDRVGKKAKVKEDMNEREGSTPSFFIWPLSLRESSALCPRGAAVLYGPDGAAADAGMQWVQWPCHTGGPLMRCRLPGRPRRICRRRCSCRRP